MTPRAPARLGSPGAAYGAVFVAEAVLFLIAARIAAGVFSSPEPARLPPAGHLAGSHG